MTAAAAGWRWQVTPAAPRAPHAMLVGFSRGPLADPGPRSPAAGARAADVAGLDLRTIVRGADPAWFDGWRSAALRAIAATDLGDLTDLDAADHVHLIIAAPTAPADLGYLQAAWAVARGLGARGASTVLDVHAHRFWRAAEVAAAAAELDVRREVRIVFETDSTRRDGAHALHTRGLTKFGAPDLVALCGHDDAALVGDVIGQLAATVAHGADLAAPRHRVELTPTTSWYVVDDRDGLADLLQLNNRARVVVDDRGHHLVGAIARLAAGAS